MSADKIPPGIIGEIGTDKPWVSAQRNGSIVRRRAPRSGPDWRSRPTGSFPPVGLAQLRIFEEEGPDPGRVIIGHAN